MGLSKTGKRIIPYGRQWVDEDDIAAVTAALRSDWLTTGPKVGEFERFFADTVDAKNAVAVSSGTAALHAATFAMGIQAGDEVIVPSMTFAATANCVVYQGGTPVFVDVDAGTLLIDPEKVEKQITAQTRAIIAVDYAGHPCNYDRLQAVARQHGLALVADACHALGATYGNRPVGSLADLSVFSFHPVKHITTGEGGMITTDNPDLAQRLRLFRNHGITTDHRQRDKQETWFYEMVSLGFNYRITDFQCALGLSQLRKLPSWVGRRQEIARRYDQALVEIPGIAPLTTQPDIGHAYHLYVVRLDEGITGTDRARVFRHLRTEGIGVNVHYIPVHLHPFYRERFGTGPGLCPVAEQAYEQIMSLPMFPALSEEDQEYVIAVLKECLS